MECVVRKKVTLRFLNVSSVLWLISYILASLNRPCSSNFPRINANASGPAYIGTLACLRRNGIPPI